MNPSEAAIETAVDALTRSPGQFQRLVERVAEVELPNLFPTASPHGRNSGDVPIRGWPDIISGANAGEVTHSPDWRSHLKKDIERNGRPGVIDSFLFVAWAREPSLDELARQRERVSEAFGIAPEQVRLIFKEQLRRILTRPRFAREWVEILGLPSGCFPFVLVHSRTSPHDSGSILFGGADSFLPTQDDYLSSRVYRPPEEEDIQRRLASDEFALVLGHGATGKTTMALNIALSPVYRDATSYYLSFYDDLENHSFASEAAMDVIATRSDRSVLFILDDIHLNGAGASHLFNHWKQVGSGSRMLLLGRHTGRRPDARGKLSPFAGVPSVELIVDARTIYGAFRRLIPATPGGAEPPEAALQGWLALFGSDLIVFGAAVQSRRESLRAGDWAISPRDAAEYVRLRYLKGLSSRERRNLLRLAVSYLLHQPLPAEATEEGDLELSRSRGIVHTRPSKKTRLPLFALVHEGVAQLILEAADPAPDVTSILREIAARFPDRGFSFAETLIKEGDSARGRAIVETIWKETDWPADAASLSSLHRDLDLLVQVLGLEKKEVYPRVLDRMRGLGGAIIGSGIDPLCGILPGLRANHQPVLVGLTELLVSEAVVAELPARCGRDLRGILHFLRIAGSDPILREVYRQWGATLFPPGIPPVMPTWMATASIELVILMIQNLRSQNEHAWVEAATDFYSTPDQLQRLADGAITAIPEVVFKLLSMRVGRRMLHLIDRAAWEDHRMRAPPRPDQFVGCVRLVRSWRDAQELLAAPARGIVRAAPAGPEQCTSLSASSIATLLKYSTAEEPERIAAFLDACVLGRDDLDAPFLLTVCETALLIAEGKLEQALSESKLVTARLPEILKRQVDQPGEAAAAVALLGMALQLGVEPEILKDTALDEDLLELALVFELHLSLGSDSVLALILFWLGMRHLANGGSALGFVPRSCYGDSLGRLQSRPVGYGQIAAGQEQLEAWLATRSRPANPNGGCPEVK